MACKALLTHTEHTHREDGAALLMHHCSTFYGIGVPHFSLHLQDQISMGTGATQGNRQLMILVGGRHSDTMGASVSRSSERHLSVNKVPKHRAL